MPIKSVFYFVLIKAVGDLSVFYRVKEAYKIN